MSSTQQARLKIWLAVFWLILTLSLALWWMSFSLNLLNSPKLPAQEVKEYRLMLYWEGAAWIVLLLGGAGFLISAIRRESRRFGDYVKFISSYNHDAKTTLMNIMLQGEILREHSTQLSPAIRKAVDRLGRSVQRLRNQIENSLYLSNQPQVPLVLESVFVEDFVRSVSGDYQSTHPELQISLQGDFQGVQVRADKRALESVFRNLIENSLRHGRATEIVIRVESTRDSVSFDFSDNGVGLADQESHQLFSKGLGLGLVEFLVNRMGGRSEVEKKIRAREGCDLRVLFFLPRTEQGGRL